MIGRKVLVFGRGKNHFLNVMPEIVGLRKWKRMKPTRGRPLNHSIGLLRNGWATRRKVGKEWNLRNGSIFCPRLGNGPGGIGQRRGFISCGNHHWQIATFWLTIRQWPIHSEAANRAVVAWTVYTWSWEHYSLEMLC